MRYINTNYFKLFMRFNGIEYGKNLTLRGIPIIHKNRNSILKIGIGCVINSSILSNLIGLYQRTIIIARENSEIIIGDNVGISGATIYSRVKISIGDNTNIGANAKIIDNDFHPVDPIARINNSEELIGKKQVVIGKNVFVGCNSIILKGTVIGDNCVIGAGSVVSGVFPDNSVIAGNPAKVVKSLANNYGD